MTSLSSYVQRNDDNETNYRHVIDILMQGIASHAVPADQPAYDRFRDEMERVAAILTSDANPSELVTTAGELTRSLEYYTRLTSEVVQKQQSELQKIISMLAATVIKFGPKSQLTALLRTDFLTTRPGRADTSLVCGLRAQKTPEARLRLS